MEVLTTSSVYKILVNTFPKQNDFAQSDYKEELNELFDFEIKTELELQTLLQKHKEEVLAIDAEPLDDFHIQTYKAEYDKDFIEHKIKNKFWFAFPALLELH